MSENNPNEFEIVADTSPLYSVPINHPELPMNDVNFLVVGRVRIERTPVINLTYYNIVGQLSHLILWYKIYAYSAVVGCSFFNCVSMAAIISSSVAKNGSSFAINRK